MPNLGYTAQLIDTMVSYEDALTAEELRKLLGFDVAMQVQNIINILIKKGHVIEKGKAGRYTTYKYISRPLPRVKVTEVNKTVPVKDTVCALTDKCYYLIKAGATITSHQVADFYDLSYEEASVLMNKVASKYQDVQLTVTARIK